MSFHGHSCPSIMIICIQPQTWGASGRGRGCGNGTSLFLFFCFLSTLGVGALRKLRTLRIGSGGTEYSMYNASHSYVKISVFTELMIWMRERERERDAEQEDVRIESCCFRTLILKVVCPLESLEDRIVIHIWIDFYVHP